MHNDKKKEEIDKVLKELEEGIKGVFTSDKFKEYLMTMSKLPRYSINNITWLYMQNQDIQVVAGYNTWKRLGRQVKKGEKALKVLAPMQRTIKEILVDPKTEKPIIDPKTNKSIEVQKNIITGFKAVSVFDIEQTQGKEIPTIANELKGNVNRFAMLKESLTNISKYPVEFQQINNGAKGYFDQNKIVIKEGMSEAHTIKTMVHEITHSRLHEAKEGGALLSKYQKENEAEAVAFVVCNRYGIDTSSYSFEYLASWSKDKELDVLKSSLDTIRSESEKIISELEEKLEKKLEISKDIFKVETKEKNKDLKTKPESKKSSVKDKIGSAKKVKSNKNIKDKDMIKNKKGMER